MLSRPARGETQKACRQSPAREEETIGSTCVLLYNYHIVPGDRTDLLRLPRAKHRRDAKHEVLRETTGRLKSCYSSL